MLVPNTMLSDAPPGPDLPVEAFEHVVLSDGRRLFYLDQGDPNGIPVLHLHNNAYGAELPRQAVVEAKKKGLRIIAPYRAGGGDSDPVETKGADEFLNQIADDNHELLQKLGIKTPLVVAGWAVGTPHALRFATRYPDDVLKTRRCSTGTHMARRMVFPDAARTALFYAHIQISAQIVTDHYHCRYVQF